MLEKIIDDKIKRNLKDQQKHHLLVLVCKILFHPVYFRLSQNNRIYRERQAKKEPKRLIEVTFLSFCKEPDV